MTNGKMLLTAVAVVAAAGMSSQTAWSQKSGVKAGTLSCNVAGGWGVVFGSTQDVRCSYSDATGSSEHYVGHIGKFGVALGYTAGGIMVWAVLAPTSNVGKGALAGTYVGATGGASVGVGAAANVLVGGSQQSVSLQPVNIEGTVGLNVAAGVAQLVLRKE